MAVEIGVAATLARSKDRVGTRGISPAELLDFDADKVPRQGPGRAVKLSSVTWKDPSGPPRERRPIVLGVHYRPTGAAREQLELAQTRSGF